MLLAGLGQINITTQFCWWLVAVEVLHEGEAALSSSHLLQSAGIVVFC